MRTLLIDVDRLGPVVLREAPRRLERDGGPVINADGEALFMGRLVVPGGARSTYSDVATPKEVRYKRLGSDGGLQPGIVRLGGKCTITRWYQRGGRGQQASSELTVSAERVESAPGERAQVTGWLPVRFQYPNASDLPMLIDEVVLEGGGWRVFLSMPAGSVEGVAEVDSKVPVSHLVGQYVQPELWAKLVVPDVEDLSRNVKAELPLLATGWSPQPVAPYVSNGRRRSEPAEAEVAAS